MSIRDSLKLRVAELLAAKRLHCLEPLYGSRARCILASGEVYEAVTREGFDDAESERLSHFRNALDRYLRAERRITVRERPPRPEERYTDWAELARVGPVEANVWDFRVHDPYDGVRCFGRFAGKDAFVALTWAWREDIRDEQNWSAQRDECIETWVDLLKYSDPHNGSKIDEFLSQPFSIIKPTR
jgi:hypothetical protein